MRTNQILGTLALVVTGIAMPNALMAASSCSTANNYQDLINLGTCTIGDLTFGGFHFLSSASGSGGTPVTTQLTVQVLNGQLGTAFGYQDPTGDLLYGFNFNPNLSVIGVGREDIQISYWVGAPTDELSSVHLGIIGSGTPAGAAAASVSESDCGFAGTPYSGAPGQPTGSPTQCFNPQLFVVQPSSSSFDKYENVGPFGAFTIAKDITVLGTTSGSFASASGILDAFDKTVVPEPASISFVAFGLIAALEAVRRRRQAQ